MTTSVGTGRLPGFFPPPVPAVAIDPGPGDGSMAEPSPTPRLAQANVALVNALAWAKANIDSLIDTSQTGVIRLLALGLLTDFGRVGEVETNNWLPMVVSCETSGAVPVGGSPPFCVQSYPSVEAGALQFVKDLYPSPNNPALYPTQDVDPTGQMDSAHTIDATTLALATWTSMPPAWVPDRPTRDDWNAYVARVLGAIQQVVNFMGLDGFLAITRSDHIPGGLVDGGGASSQVTYLPVEDKARVSYAAALLADAWPASTLPPGTDPVVSGQIGLQSLLTVLRSLSNFGQIGLSPNTQETNNWLLVGSPLDPTAFCPVGTLPSVEVQRCVYTLNSPTESASNVLLQLALGGGYLPQALYTGDVGQLAYALYKDGYLPGLTEAAWKQKVAELKDTSAFIATTIGQSNRMVDTGWKPTDFSPVTGTPPTSVVPTGHDGPTTEVPGERKETPWGHYALWGSLTALTLGGFYLLVRHEDKPWSGKEPVYSDWQGYDGRDGVY